MNGYLTAAGYGEAEIEDKRSRFLAHVRPVSSETEAKAFLEAVRAKYPDATHHVYAYLLREGNILRWSDDGEPGGTSGQPTLNVLQGAGLTDVICVTARYFGGTPLGSGGLVRAYSSAARAALNAAGTARMTLWREGAFRCSYARYERLCRLLTDRGARVEESSFGEAVEVRFTAPQAQCEAICGAIREFTSGDVEPVYGNSVYRPESV